jgi:NAD(P)-dependent dehydrogenase (short-subunit alcohol dehydrogenase family)
MIGRVSVALVTGTSSGFGQGVAERLVRLGWTVVGTSRNPARATAPAGCEMIALDLRDPASIAAAADAVVRSHGRLDALVSNAGIAVLGPLEQLSMAEIREQLEVNLIGTLDLCRACVPALRESQGVIVQISSISGRLADEAFGAYGASKFGLGGVSDALSDELAEQGVRVVVVEPGPFRTPITSNVQLAAARDDSGRYARLWRELDEWIEWFPEGAEDPEIAIDAIVAAVTVAGAPRRLPVGKDTAQELREQAAETLVAVDHAVEFLAANRGLGRVDIES